MAIGHRVDSSDCTAVGPAVEHLIKEVACLCALAGISERQAMAAMERGFRLRAAVQESTPAPCIDPLQASQVLSEWHENLEFLAPDGAPARLSITSGQFNRLCRAAHASADAAEILNLLSDAKAIRREGDFVVATRRELILGENHPGGVPRAVRMLGGLASTFNHNLTRPAGDPGRFERSVATTNLPKRHLASLIAYLETNGEAFLEDLDSWMASRKRDDSGPTIGVGIYLFVERELRGQLETHLPSAAHSTHQAN